MATWLQQFGDWNTNMNAGIFGGKNTTGVMQQASGFGKAMGSLGINAGNIGGIANTIGQLGTGLLAGQNHSAVGDIMQTVGGLASNIPGVGGLIGAGVGVVGGLINATVGSNINEEFVSQTKGQANALGSRVFNANTNADLLNDWQSMITQSNVSKSEVGSDGLFSNKASRETRRLNERIDEANQRQLANFDIAAQNVDDMNDLRILQNMVAYGGPINSFRKYYADGGLFNTPQFFTFEPQTYDKGGYLNQAKALIRQNEGWSAKPYSDSPKGKNWRSVGYGFNDSGFRDKYPEGISKHYEHGITKKQAEEELDYFLNKAEKQLKSIYGKQWNDFSDSQKAAILDTYYQRPASVDKSSRFYKAITAGEDAGKYLGVAGFNKRNSIRQNVFSGGKSTGQEYSMNDDSENTLTHPSPILEATSPIVDYSEAFAGVTPTQAKALELNFAAPNMDFLASLGQPTRQAQTTPTVGTVEDFLASYGDFEENLFEKGGNLYGDGGGIFGIMPMMHLYGNGGPKPVTTGGIHRKVQRGDTLSKIAKEYTGNAMRYNELAKLNNIANPDVIEVGQDLFIPQEFVDTIKNNELSEVVVTGHKRQKKSMPRISLEEPKFNNSEKVNSLHVAPVQNRTKSIENLNAPNFIESKIQDVKDVFSESGGIGDFLQTAWNGVAKHFVDDKQVKTQKRQLKTTKETPKEVLDEAFSKETRNGTDTLTWDRVPVDRTGNKYYIQESYPITDDMRFGSRNRLEYRDLDSNNAPLTTYRPIHKYEDYVKGITYGGKNYKAVDRDSEGHQNHFMGYDKEGKFKIGPLSKFGPGDTMTPVYYSDIIGVPRDANGNIQYVEDKRNPGRFQPVVDVYGESVYDKDGKLQRGAKGKGVLTTMSKKRSLDGSYGNVSGGRVLLQVGNETRLVSGSIEHVIQELELMQKNHKGQPVRYYQLDNGSYNRGLRTRNGKNISAQDLRDYDKQNTSSAGGGHFMYIKNEYSNGGLIPIAPSKKGTFTAAATKQGLGGNLFEGGDKLNIKDMNIFDFGGGITHGVNWDTGVDYVAEGQSHEQNPYGGVMVGQDEEGTPNLVEEGEYIWNSDYVFSRRMKVPKKLREKYKLPDDATFADAVKVLTKESEERPNDEISRATQDHILGELADSQEELRAAKAQRAMDKQMQLQDDFLMGMQFGLGGGLFADGGGTHIDLSKKGTFKAQASKMGMGVQEAASHILANKENYSPAMVKKAVFAHNFAHADGGNLFTNPFAYGGELGNVFAGEGDKPNSLMYTVDDRSLARRLFGDNGFTRFMENTAEAVNDPIGYFAGDEIEAIMNKVAQMSEPQLQRFFSTGMGQAVADAIVKSSDNNGGKQYQEAGMQRWVKATGRMAKPIQKAVVESAKRAMAQSKQIARSQMKTPKGGGKPTRVAETTTPVQSATQSIRGGVNQPGWSTNAGPSTSATIGSGQAARPLNARVNGTAGRGAVTDPFAGLEGTMNFGTPASSYLPWVIGTGIGGAGLYQLTNMGDDVVASETTSPSAQVTSNKRTENRAGNSSQLSKPTTKLGNPLSGMMLNGNILGVNDPVTNAIINALPSELGSKKSKGTEGSKVGNTKAVAPVSTVPADYNWEQEAPWLFGNVAAPQEQLSPMEQIARDKSTPTRSVSVTDNGTNFSVTDTTPVTTRGGITDDGTDDAGLTKSPFKPKQTWTRYAPLAMNALFGLKEMMTPADYTNANAIMDAAYQVGTPVSIGTEYIGDYRKRDPFDESYLMNIINQNSRAANRNFMNTSGGNKAVAMSGILANDLVTQRSLAEAARQAYLANRADDAQVAEFNRGTNIFNAQAQNQRNQYLAGLNSQRQNAMLSGISQGARLRQAIKDQRDAAISANLSAFAQGLGDIGWENYGTNQVNALFENGYTPYWLSGKGNVNFRDNG